MAPRPRKLSRRQKLIAFAPALVVGCMTVFVASGASLVPGATASQVNITGSVNGSISTDATMTGCAATENLANFATSYAQTPACTVTFAANYASGAEIQYEDTAVAQPAFFCSDGVVGAGGTRDCSVAANRVENVAANSAITNDTLGLGLTAVGGTGIVPTAGAGVEAAQAAAAGTAMWYPITDADRELCFTAAPTTNSTCTFVIGADGDAATGSGDYTGQIDLSTVQN